MGKVPLAKTLTDSSGNAAIDNDLAYYWWLFVACMCVCFLCVVVYWHKFSGLSPMKELCQVFS